MRRIMILLQEGFKQSLRDAVDLTNNPEAELDMLLSDLSDEEKKHRKEEYHLDLRIMKAVTLDDLTDITFEQVLDCIASSELFGDLFVQQKARYYAERFERIRALRSQRRRRVL